MKFIKITFLFLIIFILSIGAVSAGDESFGSLQYEVNSCDGALDLDCDYVFSSDDASGVFINNDIRINGNNHTIDARNSTNIFTIANSEAYLENINFINANGDLGGALDVIDSTITLKNCRFVNNSASCGGAICFEYACGGLIEDCIFVNNSANSGVAIYFAECYDNKLTISNSIFNNGPVTGLEIINSDGDVRLNSGGNLLNHQMHIPPYTFTDDLDFNLSLVNVSANELVMQSFDVNLESLNDYLENEPISFEVYKNDVLLINTTGITDSRGIANIDYNGLEVDNYTLNVYYKTFTDMGVIKPKKEINFTMSVEDIYVGDDLIVYYNITKNLSGNALVAIWYNDTYYYDEDYSTFFREPAYDDFLDLNNNFTVIPALPVGKHSIFLYYMGDDIYKAKTINQTFNVYPRDYNLTGNKSILVADNVFKYYGGNERLNIQLTDKNVNPLKNKEILIKVNGVTYRRMTNDVGNASIALNLESGNYRVAVIFDGDENNLPAAVTLLASISPTIHGSYHSLSYCKNSERYLVYCFDSEGNPLDSGDVKFNINGVFYTRSIGDDGFAGLNINLDHGNYTITSINLLTGEKTSGIIEILPTITDNNDLVKYYRNDSQFEVQLQWVSDISNQMVTFNINGVFYERYTNENGTAKLNINLAPGEYIITSEFNGCRVSNKITVLPILKADDLVMEYMDGSKFEAALLDGKGNPLANTDITFNINGVFYTRASDSNGVARLNINLMKGEYIITSSYNGSNIANKITIV